MELRTTVYEAGQQFDEILREVAELDNSYLIERSGEAVVAVVPIYIYAQWQRQQLQALALLRQAQNNADMDTDEAEQFVSEEIALMRAERRTMAMSEQ